MANSAFLRSLISNPTKITSKLLLKPSQILVTRPFSSSEPESNPISPNPNSTPAAISPDSFTQTTTMNPYHKDPVAEKKLIEEFFKARTDGLFATSASNVRNRMSARRLRLFQNSSSSSNITTTTATNQVMNTSKVVHEKTPDVIAHIAVIEAYANAGQIHQNAYRNYLKMLGPGVIPNEITYNKLIQLLASTSKGDSMMIGQAQKYFMEMLDKGIRPDAHTSVAIFKALAKEGKVREGKEFLEDIKVRGFQIDDKVYKVVLKGGKEPARLLQGKGGRLIKTVLEMLFDKKL